MSIIMSRNVNGAISSIAFRISSANGVSSPPSCIRAARDELCACLSSPVSFIILHCSSSEISGWLGGVFFVFFAFLRAMDADEGFGHSVSRTERK